jgi:UPF0716 family protein affecting phage T7 exclusion
MAGLFTVLAIAVVGLLLAINAGMRVYHRFKTRSKGFQMEQIIGAIMLIGLVILFMFYGPIIMF